MFLLDFVNKFLKKNVSEGILQKVEKKNVTRFWPLRGLGVWSWVNPLKKENLRQKSVSDNVEWSSTDINTAVKQEIKKLVAVSYNFSQKYLLKNEIQHKTGLYFSLNLGWHSIPFDPLSVAKDTSRRSLSGWRLSFEFKVYLEKFSPSPEM